MKQIARQSITDAVTESLRNEIATGTWRIGDRIPSEPALIASLGVSRTAVREAVRGLVHAGLLETRQGAGTYVIATDATEVALQRRLATAKHSDVVEVRRGLDVIAARLAAERRTPEQLAAIRAALDERDRTGAAGDEAGFVAADVEFHVLVARASGNEIIDELYGSLSRALATAARDDRILNHFHDETADRHKSLFSAIEAGDPRAAEAAALALADNANLPSTTT